MPCCFHIGFFSPVFLNIVNWGTLKRAEKPKAHKLNFITALWRKLFKYSFSPLHEFAFTVKRLCSDSEKVPRSKIHFCSGCVSVKLGSSYNNRVNKGLSVGLTVRLLHVGCCQVKRQLCMWHEPLNNRSLWRCHKDSLAAKGQAQSATGTISMYSIFPSI